MNKYIYTVGTVTLALLMGGLPAAALAENGVGEVKVDTQVRVQTQLSGEATREQQKQTEEVARAEQKGQLEATNSENSSDEQGEVGKSENDQDEIDLDLEEEGVLARTSDDLNQKIEERKHELEQEVASTSPEHQAIVADANEVRLAVHSLLASKELLGGIGQQVSEIAKEVDHSVASTTNAEAKIQARGFLLRLLFGGDSTSADVIAQVAAQNQARIENLTTLLSQANISVEVQATLTAQIAALKAAQVRLQDLAQKEKSAWGLFSWRF